MRSFPEQFDYSEKETWAGPRARRFPRREDAFQELVGDALREELGLSVQVCPTRGQDGSIDAFLETDAPETGLFAGVPGPIIFECKDNDDKAKAPATNIMRAWQKVEAKLKRKADKGWSGCYQPWSRARAYVYITSAVLPYQQAHDDLRKPIEEFFVKLRQRRKSSIERVVVIDWRKLRPSLERHVRLIDMWMGIDLGSLVSHPERMAELKGSTRYLVDIPFVAPLETDEAHPKRLFERTCKRADEGGGVLLVGPGGIGKTRRLFEVASLADAAGWRVLHAIHGGSPTRYEEIHDEVLRATQNTLILCDYLDRLQLDIASIKRRLLPQAARRRLRVAFLASARARHDVAHDPEHAQFFDVLELRTDTELAARVRLKMSANLAPRAHAILGQDRLDILVGERPIIALFILLQLESLAKEGHLEEAVLRGVRSGELIDWLRRRLHEHKLVVTHQSSPMEEDRIEPSLVASAAVLCAVPNTAKELQTVARGALARRVEQHVDLRALERRAENIVATLQELGWLEEDDGELSATHDVVADQIIGDVLRADRDRLREEIFDVLLEPSRTSAALLRRMAITVRRQFGTDGPFERAVDAHAKRWLGDAAPAVGQALEQASSEEASRALIAMVGGPPWGDVIPDHWGDIIVPWLRQHGSTEDALFVLMLLLIRKDLTPHAVAQVTSAAMNWLASHGKTEMAGVVLMSLLEQFDRAPQGDARVTEAVLTWHAAHSGSDLAGAVLGTLLKNSVLTPETNAFVVREVLAWCDEHGMTLEAAIALGALLQHGELDGNAIARMEQAALAWLESYRDRLQACFVLAGLMLRAGVSRGDAVRDALAWCDVHGTTLFASIVLGPLLGSTRAGVGDGEAALQRAWIWFERWKECIEVGAVLPDLAREGRLTREQLADVARVGLEWLEACGSRRAAFHVLRGLLLRPDIDPKLMVEIHRAALEWLTVNRDLLQAGMILGLVLDYRSLAPEHAASLVSISLSWVGLHRDCDLFGFVAGTLIPRRELDPGNVPPLMDAAFAWLETHPDTGGILLAGIVARIDISVDVAAIALDKALVWVRSDPSRDDGFTVLTALLTRNNLEPALMTEMRELALTWLDRHRSRFESVFLLKNLLGQVVIRTKLAGRAARAALRWLECHRRRYEAIEVYQYLLARERFGARVAVQASVSAGYWLADHADRKEAFCVLQYVVASQERDPAASALTLSAARRWLAVHGLSMEARFVICPLLTRSNLDADVENDIVRGAIAWLEQNGSTREAGDVLMELFGNERNLTEFGEEVVRDALRLGEAWWAMVESSDGP